MICSRTLCRRSRWRRFLRSAAPFSYAVLLLLAGLMPVAGPGTAAAQMPAEVSSEELVPGKPIAEFNEARDLAVDDRGAVYVLDSETASITKFGEGARSTFALSATGASGAAFSEPVDLDPTNGLTLIVADAGRSELQWYSRSLRLLETRSLSPTLQRQSRRSGYGAIDEVTDPVGGRPVSVVSTVRKEVFSIDGDAGVVYHWDSSGRFVGRLGVDGEGRLTDPVDLATSGEVVLAADNGRDAVVVFDRFGSYVRTIAVSSEPDVQAIYASGRRMLLTCRNRILIYSLRGRLIRRYLVELDEPLVDSVRTTDAFYLLTATKLFHLPTE